MDDDEDFLAAVEADNKGVPEEPVKVEVVEPETAPEPALEPEAEPQAEAKPETLELTELAPEQTKPTEGFVPLGAVLDEREKRRAAEAERDALRASQAQQQFQMPDAYEDPEGFAAAQQALLNQRLQTITLNTSERFARKEHGEETVEAAKAWALQRFASDPLYQQQILNDPDPYDRAVRDYRLSLVASEISDPTEFEQFKAWKAAQQQLQQQPGGQPPPPNQPPSIPPKSLASAPSAGTILDEPVQSDEDIFKEVIPKG